MGARRVDADGMERRDGGDQSNVGAIGHGNTERGGDGIKCRIETEGSAERRRGKGGRTVVQDVVANIGLNRTLDRTRVIGRACEGGGTERVWVMG